MGRLDCDIHKKQGKIKFINDLIESVRGSLLKDVDRMPDEWDGIELRQLLRDRLDLGIIKRLMTTKRKRDYNNTININNLL